MTKRKVEDSQTTALAHFDRARSELELASSVDEVVEIHDRAEMLRAYAKQTKESLEMQNMIAEIKIRAERKAGELLKAIPREQGKRTDITSAQGGTKLQGLSISRRRREAWQQIADVPEEAFEEHIATVKGNEDELTSSGILRFADKLRKTPHVSRSSANNEWYTPAEYIEAARLTMGSIDLDPATSREANAVVGAANIFTIDDDGLLHEWHGKVWLNPPYAASLIGQFADKLVAEVTAGNTEEAIILVNNATETRWFQSIASISSALCLPIGRIRYRTPLNGQTSGSPLQGQILLYVGKNKKGFAENFCKFGAIYEIHNF